MFQDLLDLLYEPMFQVFFIIGSIMLILPLVILVILWKSIFSNQQDQLFEPDLKLSGKITDDESGKPIPKARIAVHHKNNTGSYIPTDFTSDDEGQFTLKTINQEQKLSISAPGYNSKLISISPSEDDYKVLDITLKR